MMRPYRQLLRFAWRSVAVSLLAAGCARRETPAETGIREQVLHLGNGSEPRDLDPHVVVSFNDFNIVLALFEGLEFVMPEQIQELAVPVIAHRVVMEPQACFSGQTARSVVEEVVKKTRVPA